MEKPEVTTEATNQPEPIPLNQTPESTGDSPEPDPKEPAQVIEESKPKIENNGNQTSSPKVDLNNEKEQPIMENAAQSQLKIQLIDDSTPSDRVNQSQEDTPSQRGDDDRKSADGGSKESSPCKGKRHQLKLQIVPNHLEAKGGDSPSLKEEQLTAKDIMGSPLKYPSQELDRPNPKTEQEKKDLGSGKIDEILQNEEKKSEQTEQLPSPQKETESPEKEENKKNDPQSKPKIALSDFTKVALLGRGSYAEVFLVKKNSNNKVFALKAIDKIFMKKEGKEHQVYVEREVLRKLDSPGIIKLYSSFQDRTKLYFILEYVGGGEFSDYLRIYSN